MSFSYTNLPHPLEDEIIEELFNKVDIESLNKVIEHNLRLVVHIAKKFYNTGVDIEELISVGTLGLMKATRSYSLEKGTKFATYASRCIENEILMYLRRDLKHSQVSHLSEPLSVDWDGNELKIEDICPADIDLEEDYCQKEELVILIEVVNTCLSEREKAIITMFFGLNGSEEYTQREIAIHLGISQSYISRLIDKILKKLKIAMQKRNEVQRTILSKKDKQQLLELSEKPLSMEELTSLPPKHALVLSLTSGYTGRYHTSHSVAKYLEISEIEVAIILKETLDILNRTKEEQNNLDSPSIQPKERKKNKKEKEQSTN